MSTSAGPVLRVDGVAKRYGDTVAVASCSLSVAGGEVVGLLGPNGSGKTTTLSMVAGLLTPDAGRIAVDGHDPRSSEARRLIGVAEQHTALYQPLTVRENLEAIAGFYSLGRKAAAAHVEEVVERLGLHPLLRTPVRELSGGMQRLVHVAAALVHKPRLAVLDEPSVGLDVEARARLHQALKALAAEGTAVLVSSHDMTEVERVCREVVILARGHVVASGQVPELLSQFGRPWAEVRVGEHALDHAERTIRKAGASEVARRADGALVFSSEAPAAVLGALFRSRAIASELSAVSVVPTGLESVYVTVTGRRFGDDDADAAHASAEAVS